VVRRLRDALAPGSHLAISHITRPPADSGYRGAAEGAARTYRERGANTGMTFRDPEQIAGFFDGMELLEPGLVGLPDWRPHPELGPVSGQGLPPVYLCGVGRKDAR
jgi:hypothetical protein